MLPGKSLEPEKMAKTRGLASTIPCSASLRAYGWLRPGRPDCGVLAGQTYNSVPLLCLQFPGEIITIIKRRRIGGQTLHWRLLRASQRSKLFALFHVLLTKAGDYPHFTNGSHLHKATQRILAWPSLTPEPKLLTLMT